MMNTAIEASTTPQNGAAAHDRKALVKDVQLLEFVQADRGGVGPRRGQRVVDHQSPPSGDMGISANTIAGAWLLGVSWNACEPINMPM